MPINNQDFVHGVDFTGLNPATGADHNTLVDSAVTYQDSATNGKGLILVTKDTALNTPDVPNAGLIVKWKKYLWLRVPHATAASHQITPYAWNDDSVSDATFLKWTITNPDLTTLIANVATALTNAGLAISTANLANLNSGAAQIAANSALTNATAANTTANTASANAAQAETDAQTAIANAASAQTTANNALANTAGTKNINDILKPGTSLQRLRTNNLAAGVEWFLEKDNYALITEQYANGNNGVAGVNGAAQDRVLNTIVQNMSPIVGLYTNKFITFAQPGTYYIRAKAPVTNSGQAKHVLAIVKNDVGSTILLTGCSANHNTSANPTTSYAEVCGKILIADGDAVKLVHYIFNSSGGITLGEAVSGGLAETYASVELIRL